MPIVPQLALVVILHSWSTVVALVSQLLYERVTRQYQHHFLVQFDQVIDLSRIEQACMPFYKGSGPGSWTRHTVPQLVRGLLIKYLHDLSYRQTEAEVDLNIMVKYWVGYNLLQRPFDHTTLWRFEMWVLEHQPRLLFDEILRQIDALCPEDRRRMQLVDTYAMLVRGAKTSLIELIRDVCRHLLAELKRADPARHAHLVQWLDQEALFGVKGDKPTVALDREEREARLQAVVTQALRLHRLAQGLLASPPFLHPDQQAPIQEWLGHLAKIIDDETTLDPTTAPAEPVPIKELPHGQKGQYRIACANDPEATYRDHGQGKQQLAHNAAVLTTTHFVRETEVVTGATPDPVPLITLLQLQHRHHGFFPAEMCGDQIFGTGKTRHQVAELTNGQTHLIALVPDYDKRTDRFVPADFTLTEDGLGLTCPHGVTTYKRYPKANADGWTYRFTAKMCRHCPFWLSQQQLALAPDQPHCRTPDCKANSHRQVFINTFRDYTLAALEFNRTDEFKLKIKQRPIVERIIFNLTNIHGGRRAKSTGLPKANFQTRMVSTAFNIRQLLRLWARRPQLRAQKPPPPAAAVTSVPVATA
jgi:hypothetical protein